MLPRPFAQRTSSRRQFPLDLQLAPLPLWAPTALAVPLVWPHQLPALTRLARILALIKHRQLDRLNHGAYFSLDVILDLFNQGLWGNRKHFKTAGYVILLEYVVPVTNCKFEFAKVHEITNVPLTC